jgi:hypothetical protein
VKFRTGLTWLSVCFVACGCQPPPVTNHVLPAPVSNGVPSAILAGKRLENKHKPEDPIWEFRDATFALVGGRSSIPAAVLGLPKEAQRVEGRWRIDESGALLLLTELKVDGQPAGTSEVRLPVSVPGKPFVNIGSLQYNERTAERLP